MLNVIMLSVVMLSVMAPWLGPQTFCRISPSGQYYKTFLGAIYATSGVFPYDFDWGYADSDVIMSKKVL
jgi:hypothetical protein